MPELPEVQTVADELHLRLVGRRIEAVEILWERTIGSPSSSVFASALIGAQVAGVGRRAKYIRIALHDGATLMAHLRMTGRFTIDPAASARPPHTRVALGLDDDTELRFADTRKFGRLYLVAPGETLPLPSYAALGPEPLESTFTATVLAERLAARRGRIKAALLDQRLVAGLGNIYVDEALFQARLHPQRAVPSLSQGEVATLHASIVQVLQRALSSGGTSFSDYRTTWGQLGAYQDELQVFRQTGAPCPACGTPIERTVVVGRGTHFCPRCQTL